MERITAMTSAPACAAARACSTSSWMLPVATMRYLCGRSPMPSSALRALRSATRRRSSSAAARASARISSRSARSSPAGSGSGFRGSEVIRSTTCRGSRAPRRSAHPIQKAAPCPSNFRSWRASTMRFTSGTPRGPASWKPSCLSTVRSIATVVWRSTKPITWPLTRSASARQRDTTPGSRCRSGTTRPSESRMAASYDGAAARATPRPASPLYPRAILPPPTTSSPA